jgi:hypothetical protein
MTRRFGNGKLSQGAPVPEDINPLDGMANLADIMLVFACGLMLALIINWNVDIGGLSGKTVTVQQGREVTAQLHNAQTEDGADLSKSDQYEEMGVVYKDPATGKMYLVTMDKNGG